MPVTLDRPEMVARLQRAYRIQSEIEKLECKLASLFDGVPRHVLTRNRYGFTVAQMTRIARNLHAKAKTNIARGESKELGKSLEDLL
jgi:hypothetical protein